MENEKKAIDSEQREKDNRNNMIELIENTQEKLTQDTYTEVDGEILSELSGSNIATIFEARGKTKATDTIGMSDVFRDLASRESDEKKKRLYEAVAKSGRYSEVELTCPINTEKGRLEDNVLFQDSDILKNANGVYRDEETREEYRTDFKAVTYLFNDNKDSMLIAYAGTGGSVYSWIEDGRFAYTKSGIGAQKESSVYFDYVASRFSDKQILTAGYSKGGNLSVYSAVINEKKYGDRIIEIKNFDGPGFRNAMLYDEDGNLTEFAKSFKKLQNKITVYSPKNSFVGKLMKNWDNYIFLDDTDQFLPMNHDFYNWRIAEDGSYHFKIAKEDTKMSKSFDSIVDNVLFVMSDREVSDMCNFLENYCKEKGIDVIGDIGDKINTDLLSFASEFLEYYATHPSFGLAHFADLLIKKENLADLLGAWVQDNLEKNEVNPVLSGMASTGTKIATVTASKMLRLEKLVKIIAMGLVAGATVTVLGEKLKEGVYAVSSWVGKKAGDIVKYLDEHVVQEAMECAKNIQEGIRQRLNWAMTETKNFARNTLLLCQSMLDRIGESIKSCWNGLNRWGIANAVARSGTAHIEIDTVRLRQEFEHLSRLVNRIQSLDNTLGILYSRLCWNDVQQGEILTSIVNLYHLVKSDIVIDDASKVKGCRDRLYSLINSFETTERRLIAEIGN